MCEPRWTSDSSYSRPAATRRGACVFMILRLSPRRRVSTSRRLRRVTDHCTSPDFLQYSAVLQYSACARPQPSIQPGRRLTILQLPPRGRLSHAPQAATRHGPLYVPRLSPVFSSIQQYSAVFSSIQQYSAVFGNIQQYIPVLRTISQ